MRVKHLIELLQRFDPDAKVQVSMGSSGRVIETFDELWIGDYGGGPELIVPPDAWGSRVFAGCGLEQLVMPVPPVDLGRYASREEAARVRDYYVLHKNLGERLYYPDFDYEHWIPPRTTRGEYNEHIAQILREKLLKD